MRVLSTLVFIAILILAFFLRAQEVLTNNYLFLIDMGRDMLAVKEIVFEQNLTLIGPYTSLAGVFQGPFYYYLLAIPTWITDGDPIGPLILMLIISLATAFTAFYFLNKHFGKIAAFIGFLLFAVSPEAIAAATYTWNPHPMWLLITLFIFLLYEMHYSLKRVQLFIWPVIGLMFHFEAALGFFLLIATCIYTLFTFKRALFTKHFFIGIFFLFLTFIPQILFELRNQFLMTNSIINMFMGNNQSLAASGEDQNILWILQNHAEALFNNFRTSFPYIQFAWAFHIIAFAGTLAALVISKRTMKLKNYTIFYSMYFKFLLLFLLLTSLYLFPLRYWFLTGFQSFYIIATAISLSLFWNRKIVKLIFAIFLVLTIIHSVERLYILYINPPNDGGLAKIKGKLAAIDKIYEYSEGKEFGMLVFTPPVYTDAYDYLIWWRARVRNATIPPQEKKETFFLLMEPNPYEPHSYKGWLETVIKTGEVEFTETLPSGLIIQKREIIVR